MTATTGDVTLLDEQAPFDEFCGAMADRGRQASVACDTEFARTNTYWPTLCLVQVALGENIVCLDVLAVGDLSVFQQALAADNGPWIFHAAKQDLEAMHSTLTTVPSRIIDTQVAAGLLGHAPQIGYGNLVEELLGIRLAKGETRTDWSRRPLTPAQLAYAADDVEHLPAVNEILLERLEAAGRLEWAEEDCAALLVTEQYESQPDLAWQRLPRIQYLPVAVQARARRLAAWREARATSRNRPRKWILDDKPLLQIAHANPASTADLAGIRDLPPAVIRNSADALLEQCRQANADVGNGDIDFTQQAKPAAPEENAVKKLSAIVRATAKELELAPELLATRKELNGLLRGRRDVRSLSGWRRKVIGERLLEAL
jgi:ribonuclease D